MPTEKIADCPIVRVCRHPDHNPPTMRLFKPGTYQHTCAGCGKKIVFHVAGHTLSRWTGRVKPRWDASV